MIRLTCTKCQATLEMDEAFAGGVCRCQYCGTIQTVPAHLKSAPTTAGTYPQPVAAKSLYQSPGGAVGRPPPASGRSELEALADQVALSGLSSGRLSGRGAGPQGTQSAQRPPGYDQSGQSGAHQPQGLAYQTPPAEKKNNTRFILIIAGAAAGLVLIVVLAVFFLRSSSPAPTPPGGSTGTAQTTGTPAVTGPHFAGIPLNEKRIVYVLDRGDASKQLFDPLKYALYQSLKSLGPDREFQVIFWKRSMDLGLDEGMYPSGGLAKATPDQIDAVQAKFEDLTPSGATEIDQAIRTAMAANPDAVVIVTPKFSLDETFVTAVDQARGNSKVKVHGLALGSGDIPLLKAVAQKTGGTYRQVSGDELRAQ